MARVWTIWHSLLYAFVKAENLNQHKIQIKNPNRWPALMPPGPTSTARKPALLGALHQFQFCRSQSIAKGFS
eukprot:357233-Amphidinium_carterae.1